MKWEIRQGLAYVLESFSESEAPTLESCPPARQTTESTLTHLTAEESVAHKSKLNVLPMLRYLDTRSPVGGTVWGTMESLGGAALF